MSDTPIEVWLRLYVGDPTNPADLSVPVGSSVLATLEGSASSRAGIAVPVDQVRFRWRTPTGVELEDASPVLVGMKLTSRLALNLSGSWRIRAIALDPFRKIAETVVDVRPTRFAPDDQEAQLILTEDGAGIIVTDDVDAIYVTGNGEMTVA